MEDYPSVLVPRTPPLNRGGALAINGGVVLRHWQLRLLSYGKRNIG